jgi:hypothetical protein
LTKAKALMSDPTKSQQEKMMGLTELAALSPESAKAIGSLAQYTMQQQEYGRQVSKEAGQNVNPEASNNEQSFYSRVGEKVAERGGSPAQIETETKREADKLKNARSKLKTMQSPSNIVSGLYRRAQGTELSRENAVKHAQKIASQVLEMGEKHGVNFRDEIRQDLSESGQPLEFIEEVIDPLTDRSKEMANRLPPIPGEKYLGGLATEGLKKIRPAKFQEYQNSLNDNLMTTLMMNPDSNIILLRKLYEDKGYDWKMFKSAIENMQEAGFQFDPDQQKQINQYLDQPSEESLDKYFRKFYFMGQR